MGVHGPSLVVMAAGIGSRYGGLKQIDPIGPHGEIILDYSVFDALRAGFTKVVFVVRREIEATFREKVGRAIEGRVATAYVHQELSALPDGFSLPTGRVKPWGTAHAVLCAAGEVSGSFAAINADDFYGADAFRVLGDYLQQVSDHDGIGHYALVGYPLAHTLSEHGHVSRGVCTVAPNGTLMDIVERTRVQAFPEGVRYSEDDGAHWAAIAADSPVSMNIWGFTPGFFTRLAAAFRAFLDARGNDLKSECYLPSVVNEEIRAGRARVAVLPTEERWFGVTYQEDRATAQRAVQALIRQGRYPEKLWG